MTREQRKIRNKMYWIIRERGWCQYSNEDDEGRVCLTGAYNIVILGNPCRTRFIGDGAYFGERSVFCRSLIGTPYSAAWNDQANRTEKDVLRVLCPWWMTWRYPTLRKTSHV